MTSLTTRILYQQILILLLPPLQFHPREIPTVQSFLSNLFHLIRKCSHDAVKNRLIMLLEHFQKMSKLILSFISRANFGWFSTSRGFDMKTLTTFRQSFAKKTAISIVYHYIQTINPPSAPPESCVQIHFRCSATLCQIYNYYKVLVREVIKSSKNKAYILR